jgi:protocatechuate 4,5-dioxygenase alpha subunit
VPRQDNTEENDGGELPGTFVFNGRRSRRGYCLNKLAMSLTQPENRGRFLVDPEAYMSAMELSESDKDMIRRRDWQAMVQSGGNIYLLLKIAATIGQTLLQMGAQMRGQSLDDFMATRPGKGAH